MVVYCTFTKPVTAHSRFPRLSGRYRCGLSAEVSTTPLSTVWPFAITLPEVHSDGQCGPGAVTHSGRCCGDVEGTEVTRRGNVVTHGDLVGDNKVNQHRGGITCRIRF